MAFIVNTKIENQTNGYLLDAKNVKGTYVVVKDYAEMEALPKDTLVVGSLCYCQTPSTFSGFYQYDGVNWVTPWFITDEDGFGYKMKVVSELPSEPIDNVIYFIKYE